MSGYIGSTPVPQATQHRESFTCTEGQTTFNTAGYTAQFVDVYLNGSHLSPADFTATNGSDVVLGVAASADDVCDIISYTPFEVADQTFTGTIDITGELKTTTLGTSNFRAGVNAGNSIASGGNRNVVVGDEAGTALTTGGDNTLIGGLAGDALTDADENVAVGLGALTTDTLGSHTVAIGRGALETQNFTSATDSNNTAVGTFAGRAITTGTNNTFVGGLAGDGTDNGVNNVGVGKSALSGNCGDNNTAVGEDALAVATGTNNQCFGNSAGAAITSGNYNTILGQYSGNQGGLDIRTASNNIVLADGQGNVRLFYKDSTVNWQIETPAASNNALIVHNTGSSSPYGIQIDHDVDINNGSNHFIDAVGGSTSRFKVFTNGNVVNTNNSYGAVSDVKLKENIADATSQWDDIKALTVRKYSMKADELDAPNMLGVIAQEVETAGMSGLVNESPDIDKDMNDLGTTTKSVNYSILYMKAVKALQEAMTRIEALETKVTALEG